MSERAAWIHLDGWHGRSKDRVIVVGETPKRYRVRVPDDGTKYVQLAGPRRFLYPGETALVPKYAVTFEQDGA